MAPEIKPEQLKKTSEFRLIGKDVMRVELPSKINGTATYSIDLQVPGMIYGAVLESPVEGAIPEQFDESKVNAISGVIATVRLPYGVGVLADTPWAAFAGKAAVERSVTWSRTGKAWGFDSDKGIEAFATAARDLGVPVTTDWFRQGDAAQVLSTDCAAAEGERSRPTHKWGSLVLGPAVSMVPIGPRGHHDHPARDSRTLASGRLSPVLALEIPLTWRPTKDRCGPARTDPADERRKSAVGCAAHFLVYPLDFVGHYASARLYAAIIGSAAERRAIR